MIATEVSLFGQWLAGTKGYYGEVGIPSSLGGGRTTGDATNVRTAMDDGFFFMANRYAMNVTVHETSERYWKTTLGGTFADIYLTRADDVHKTVYVRGEQAPVVEATRNEQHTDGQNRLMRRGLNFSGGQNWLSNKEDPDNDWSNRNFGTYGDEYWYPTVPGPTGQTEINGENSFEYLYGRGIRLVRLGYRMERVQSSGPGGALNDDQVSRLMQSLDNAHAAGLAVVLDCHNYGGYYTTAGRQQLNRPSSGFQDHHLVDHWVRISNRFGDHPAVQVYDIMNEPYNDGGIYPDSGSGEAAEAAAWRRISQLVVDAVRGNGDSTTISIPLYRGIEQNSGGPWVEDGGAVNYSEHYYPFGASNEKSFASVNSAALDQGY